MAQMWVPMSPAFSRQVSAPSPARRSLPPHFDPLPEKRSRRRPDVKRPRSPSLAPRPVGAVGCGLLRGAGIGSPPFLLPALQRLRRGRVYQRGRCDLEVRDPRRAKPGVRRTAAPPLWGLSPAPLPSGTYSGGARQGFRSSVQLVEPIGWNTMWLRHPEVLHRVG